MLLVNQVFQASVETKVMLVIKVKNHRKAKKENVVILDRSVKLEKLVNVDFLDLMVSMEYLEFKVTNDNLD